MRARYAADSVATAPEASNGVYIVMLCF
jgi:hypothetical protein